AAAFPAIRSTSTCCAGRWPETQATSGECSSVRRWGRCTPRTTAVKRGRNCRCNSRACCQSRPIAWVPEVAGITISVPGLLRDCIGGVARADLHAATAAEAVAVMLDTYPRLRVHLYDEDGRMRDHVFLALNGSSVKR